VAFTEARGNPAAGSDAFSNAARGMFGFRATTAWNESACIGGMGKDCVGGVIRSWDEDDPELAFRNGVVSAGEVAALKDLTWAVAQAAHNVNRLRKYTFGKPFTLEGARRGWAYPSLVSDLDNIKRPELLERWYEGLAFHGYPQDFGKQPMQVLVARADFPGLHELHEIVLAAVAGGGASSASQSDDFIESTVEQSTSGGTDGYAYAWAVGQRNDLTWAWGADRYPPDADTPDAHAEGDTNTRNEAVGDLLEAIEDWESQH
jgi:hypothetical protein